MVVKMDKSWMTGIGLLALVTSGCPGTIPEAEDGGSSDTGPEGTTGSNPTTGQAPTDGATSMTPGDSGGTSTMETTQGPNTDTDGESTTDTTAGPATGETGSMAGCVDEDIGMAVGNAVASGSTMGLSDDFDIYSCYGNPGTSDDDGGFIGTSGGGFSTTGYYDTGYYDTDYYDSGYYDSGYYGSEDTGGFIFPTTGYYGTDTGYYGSEDTGYYGTDTGYYGTDTEYYGSEDTGFVGTDGDGGDYIVSWTPPDTGTYVFSLEGSSYDTFIAITPPECGAAPLDCNDDCFGLLSGEAFEATMGETVFIVIDGWAQTRGDFVLSIYESLDPGCGWGGSTG